MRFTFISLFIALIILSSCGHRKGTTGYYKVGKPYKIADKIYTPKIEPDYDETGMASWYGSDFHKKETANGGKFDRHALTAAHRTLPLPSMVKVTNLNNNKALIVMVNDRGPFSKDRILDMSERAADILGFKKKGVTKVRVQFLPTQTARLLADLPGAKGKKLSESKPFNDIDSTVVDSTDTPINMAPKIANASNDITISQEPEKVVTAIKPDVVITDEDNISSALPDADNENSETILHRLDIKKPAKESEEKIKVTSKVVSFIQVGTYGLMSNAKRAEQKLSALGTVNIVPIKIKGKALYKVKIGPIMDKKSAELILKKTIGLGHRDAVMVKEGV